jgi:hypothetical protein
MDNNPYRAPRHSVNRIVRSFPFARGTMEVGIVLFTLIAPFIALVTAEFMAQGKVNLDVFPVFEKSILVLIVCIFVTCPIVSCIMFFVCKNPVASAINVTSCIINVLLLAFFVLWIIGFMIYGNWK